MTTTATTIAGYFYEGVMDAQAWSVGLDALRQATESGVYHHVAWDYQAQCVVAGLANQVPPPEKVREYEQHHAPDDPRIPIIMAMQPGELLLDHAHFTPRAMARSPIYADWLAPLGYRHTLGVPVYDDGCTREWVCLIRPVDHRPFGSRATTLLQRLMPDLLRAARLRTQSTHMAQQAALGLAALDTLPKAVAVLDARQTVHYMNPAAQRDLNGKGPSLAVKWGRLTAHTPSAQGALTALVAAACSPLPRAGVLRLPRRGQGTHPTDTAVNVLPLQATHPAAAWLRSMPMALLVWSPHTPSAETARLEDLLGLSRTEALLACALAAGQSVKDFAQAQNCSWHTARTHLKNLLRKTGCHRQVALVQLVRSLGVV